MTAYYKQLHSIRRVQLFVYGTVFIRVYMTNRCVICFCVLLLSWYKSVDVTIMIGGFMYVLLL